jgi:hypothetical protein
VSGDKEKGHIRALWCGLYRQDIVLAIQLQLMDADGDHLVGRVAKISADAGEVRWFVDVRGNAGQPLLVGSALFVTGTGVVGKVALDRGAFVWRHEGLDSNPGMFVGFHGPRIDGPNVVFPAFHYSGGNAVPPAWPRAVVVDAESGRMLPPK